MIGVFFDENRQHSVFINGAKGTITDPLDCEDCKDLNPRCADETLKELGITKFTRVFIVEEVNLSDKDKRYLKNRNKNTIV